MANYYRVTPKFWTDTRGWPDRDRIVALYLITNRHRTTEGLYHLPKGYVQTDLGYTLKAVHDVFEFLIAEQFIAYDDDVDVVFVRNALKYQSPATAAQIKGAINRLTLVPRSSLGSAFLESCESYAPRLAEAIRVELNGAFA